jgi:arsenite/tail-anchored protein-transporting ATPase
MLGPPMRILLFTGKGGVGKTTVAAATAVRAARSGGRTLVMSTDPAHSLADAFDVPLGSDPTSVEPNLWGQQIDSQARLEEGWREIQEYVLGLLDWGGVDAVSAEELSVIPGLDEIFALTDVKRVTDDASYDLLVVDCAPTAETLRLLSLPDALNWYFERIFPLERKVAKVVRPVFNRVVGGPLIASDRVMQAVERMHRTLEEVRKILTDQKTSTVRLVMNAEKMVIAEARRTYTYLNLFGYRVDAVVCNRLLPAEVHDPYFEKWKAVQSEHLGTIREAFSPVPVLTVPLYDREMIGVELLDTLGQALYEGSDPAGILYKDEPVKVNKRGDGYVLSLRLPFTEKAELDLLRKGEDIHVKVGPYRRTFMLPSVLARLDIVDAAFEDGRLNISFERREPARGAAPGAAKGGA